MFAYHQAREIKTELLEALNKISKPSAFAYGCEPRNAPNPGLEIVGIGQIGCPVSDRDREATINKSRQSPFGKGSQTLVDTSFRRCWEIDASQITLQNPEWQNFMETAVSEVYKQLGLTCGRDNVTAELYKLLIYEKGAFFKSHQDSEKTPGMFGTMVVTIPSSHQGGDVCLAHNGKKYTYKSSANSAFTSSFAAWYSDVYHEVLPVMAGYRMVLTYNLIQISRDIPQVAPTVSNDFEALESILQTFEDSMDETLNTETLYLAHQLEHKYSEANLKLENLKGNDHKQVSTLATVAKKLGFELYLACINTEIVKDDGDEDNYEYYGHHPATTYKALTTMNEKEEFERNIHVTYIIRLDGDPLPSVPRIGESYFIDGKRFLEVVADREEHSGYTGNEGQTDTFWYNNTVVILVPPSSVPNFYADIQDLEPSSKLLRTLKQRCKTDNTALKQLHKLCELLVPKADFLFDRTYPPSNVYITDHPPSIQSRYGLIVDAVIVAVEMQWGSIYKRVASSILQSINVLEAVGKQLIQHRDETRTKDLLMEVMRAFYGLESRFTALDTVTDTVHKGDPGVDKMEHFSRVCKIVQTELIEDYDFDIKDDALFLAKFINSNKPFFPVAVEAMRLYANSASQIVFVQE